MIGKKVVEIRVSTTDLDPNELSALIGLKPDFIVRKGERFFNTQVMARESRWCMEEIGDQNSRMEELLDRLLDRLQGVREGIVALPSNCHKGLIFVWYSREANSSYYLTTEQIERIASFQCTCTHDFYSLPSDEEE